MVCKRSLKLDEINNLIFFQINKRLSDLTSIKRTSIITSCRALSLKYLMNYLLSSTLCSNKTYLKHKIFLPISRLPMTVDWAVLMLRRPHDDHPDHAGKRRRLHASKASARRGAADFHLP